MTNENNNILKIRKKKYYLYFFNEVEEVYVGEFVSEDEFWKYYYDNEIEINGSRPNGKICGYSKDIFELMQHIEPHLIENGFIKESDIVFKNDKCTIEVDLDLEFYYIKYRDVDFSECTMTSDNLNLYFLFGFFIGE